MSAAPATVLSGLTSEEFYALPDSDEYRHSELLDGEVVVTPPSLLHQRIVNRLLFAIEAWRREGPSRGEVTTEPAVEIGSRTVYVPDLAWWPSERAAPPDQPPAFDGPPALVAEIFSPSTRAFDATRKLNGYSRVGVQELWLIDPEPLSIQVFLRHHAPMLELFREMKAEGELSSQLLPGFAVLLQDLTRR